MAAADLIIGGIHAVRTALERAAPDCLEMWLRAGHERVEYETLASAAASHGIAVQRVAPATLDKLYGDDHHQGVVLRRRPPALVSLEDLPLGGDNAAPLLLVLDNIHDPRNFGACLRAADGAGVTAVVFPRDKSARLSSVVAKAASGALDSVRLVAVTNLAAALRQLRDAGIWITGAAHDAPVGLYATDFAAPSAIVLGNEGGGLRRLTRELCDHLVYIPMYGSVPSLNVATAAAVCLFEARRQRLAAAP